MILQLHFDSLIPSLFETTLNAFKTGAKEVGKAILMNIMFSFKDTNNDVKKFLISLENDPEQALQLDNEEFHDNLLKYEDMLESLLIVASQYKNDSEIFQEFYKITDELYNNIVTLGIEISAIASEQRHKAKIAS